MKRTGFKRKPHSPFSSLTRTATLKRQKAIVKRIKRPTVAEGSKYLAACRGVPRRTVLSACAGCVPS
ncbi:gp74 [Burkholderia pseudomallei]|nr:putative gp74 [Burkholderia pseudomallei MSHR332]CAJ5217271.1 gp74 [Burkholderia pseudomallei]